MTSTLAPRPAKKQGQSGRLSGGVPRFPTVPDPVPLPRFSAADDLRAAIGLWAAWLSGERRASPHTIAAYGRDLTAFFDFLTEHLGEVPGLAAIDALRPADFRAYLARRAAEGIERSSLARNMSVLRNFVRFLQRRELAATTALAALRSPKLPAAVPKPLTVDDAVAVVDSAAEFTREGWQKKRDTALLALIYGCGLRLSEALGLSRAEAPTGEALTVTGKGGKTRQLPVLAGSARSDHRLPRRLSVRAGSGVSAFCRRPRRTAASAPGSAANGGVARISRTARHRDAARIAPQLRNTFARRRGRSASDPGIAGTRQPIDDAALHRGGYRTSAGDL